MSNANFEPDRKVVTAITNDYPSVVTAASHGYESDNYVRINVPINYGMRFPEDEVKITVIDTNTFYVDVDTRYLDPFVVPSGTIILYIFLSFICQ